MIWPTQVSAEIAPGCEAFVERLLVRGLLLQRVVIVPDGGLEDVWVRELCLRRAGKLQSNPGDYAYGELSLTPAAFFTPEAYMEGGAEALGFRLRAYAGDTLCVRYLNKSERHVNLRAMVMGEISDAQ